MNQPASSPDESLWRSLVTLQGNPRASVWTEPLWGLSMALVLPYLSVFMAAVGLHDGQIGLLATIGMISQVLFAVLGGVITDKLGRRLTTAWFDVIGWVIPCLIWMVAQNFWLFLVAAIVNGARQVTTYSWDSLLIEDAPREKVPRIYALVRVAADCSALFAPIAAIMVARLGMEHAVRILMANAAVVMTIKIVWLYWWSTETARGLIRLEETKGESLNSLLRGYRGALGLLVRNRGRRLALLIAAIVAAVFLVNETFWQLFVAEHVGVSDALLPFFPMARSLLSMLFFFTVIPRLVARIDLKRPLLIGFLVYLAGQLLLLVVPGYHGGISASTFALLGVCLLLDSFGIGMVFMLSESLMALHVDPAERSRVMALNRATILVAAAPFGWIGGLLSDHSRLWPFLMTACLLAIGALVTFLRWVPNEPQEPRAVSGDLSPATS
ncbi:MAG: MFS transporter [Promicromonosporaceae bacterium]|nr:MFS transporter [Promicromonosporaceae bacterium]